MPETSVSTGSQTTSQTQETQTSTASQSTQNTSVSEPESAYDKIFKEYFSDVLGETKTGTESSVPNPNEGLERNFQALASEISSLKAQLAAAGKKPETVSTEAKKEFLDLYARGDKAGAKAALMEDMLPQIQNDVVKKVSADVLRATRAENDIRSYSESMRQKNPDLVPFERSIGLEAQDLVRQAMGNGLVNTVEEYVAASKKALDVTVDAYKKRVLQLKGEGVTQAQTRSTEIVSTSAIPPGSKQTQSQSQTAQEPDVSAENYLARRRAQQGQSMEGRRAMGRQPA